MDKAESRLAAGTALSFTSVPLPFWLADLAKVGRGSAWPSFENSGSHGQGRKGGTGIRRLAVGVTSAVTRADAVESQEEAGGSRLVYRFKPGVDLMESRPGSMVLSSSQRHCSSVDVL